VRFFRSLFSPEKGNHELGEVAAANWVQELTRETLWLGMNNHTIMLRPDMKVLHGNYARQAPGASVTQQMLNDRFRFKYTWQGHCHRDAEVIIPDGEGGTAAYGFEVGSLQNNPPLYNTGRPENWPSGINLLRYNPSNLDPIETFNVRFQVEVTDKGRVASARVDGTRFQMKYPAKAFALMRHLVRRPGFATSEFN